jgi:uncharacterized protein with GYD domain
MISIFGKSEGYGIHAKLKDKGLYSLDAIAKLNDDEHAIKLGLNIISWRKVKTYTSAALSLKEAKMN